MQNLDANEQAKLSLLKEAFNSICLNNNLKTINSASLLILILTLKKIIKY